jgi:hypothetical protein
MLNDIIHKIYRLNSFFLLGTEMTLMAAPRRPAKSSNCLGSIHGGPTLRRSRELSVGTNALSKWSRPVDAGKKSVRIQKKLPNQTNESWVCRVAL